MKKIIIYILVLIGLIGIVQAGSTYWCAQAHPNKATTCGAFTTLSTGTYTCKGTFVAGHECSYANDSVYTTYAKGDSSTDKGNLIANYSIPTWALKQSLLEIQTDEGRYNYSVPGSCWSFGKLVINHTIYKSGSFYLYQPYCRNLTSYQIMFRVGYDWSAASIIYDSRMIWKTNNINNCTNITTSKRTYNLTNDLRLNYFETCFNVNAQNITFNCNNHFISEGQDYTFYSSITSTTKNISINKCKLNDTDQSAVAMSLRYVNKARYENISINGYANSLYVGNNITIKNMSINNSATYGLNMYTNDRVFMYNSSIRNSGVLDIYLTGGRCRNIFSNVTVSDAKKVIYLNKSQLLQDFKNASLILLCNASNMKLNRVNMSNKKANNGLLMINTNKINITKSIFNNTYYSIFLFNANNTIVNYTELNNFYTSLVAGQYARFSNNHFKNNVITNGATAGTVYLNGTKRKGARIRTNGTVIGGNYYSYYYSANCNDTEHDGFCDQAYTTYGLVDYLAYSKKYNLSAPSITYPLNKTYVPLHINFTWSRAINTSPSRINYTMQVSTKTDFSTISFTFNTSNTYKNISKLVNNQIYYVRVRANDTINRTNWSITINFTASNGVPIISILNKTGGTQGWSGSGYSDQSYIYIVNITKTGTNDPYNCTFSFSGGTGNLNPYIHNYNTSYLIQDKFNISGNPKSIITYATLVSPTSAIYLNNLLRLNCYYSTNKPISSVNTIDTTMLITTRPGGSTGGGGSSGITTEQGNITAEQVKGICGNRVCEKDKGETPYGCPTDCIPELFKIDEIFCYKDWPNCGNWQYSWFTNILIIGSIAAFVFIDIRRRRIKNRKVYK